MFGNRHVKFDREVYYVHIYKLYLKHCSQNVHMIVWKMCAKDGKIIVNIACSNINDSLKI